MGLRGGNMLKQNHEDREDFAREAKNAKVQKVFFRVETGQQPIKAPFKQSLPDGTQEVVERDGIRLISTITLTAVTPHAIDEKQTQLERQMILAGNQIQFIHTSNLAAKDCFDDEDFTAFTEEVKNAKELVLGDVQKVANVILFPGTTGDE